MIRQEAPNRSIILASPDGYFSGIKKLCEEYGGHFHNTGHMSGFWNDFLPTLMRGADLPFSLEPGVHARTLEEIKTFMGRWLTEGIQAVHYFIHVGYVLWPEDIRKEYERIQPLIGTIGKVHPPKARFAVLLSNRTDNLTGYPWGNDYNVNLPTGYWAWRFSDALVGEYHVDAVTDADFDGGAANGYPIIIDTNTSVMDEATVERIEKWVRDGGTFVTFVQTGRHTPEKPDSWPISRLTGYRVTAIDPHSPDGREGRTRAFTLAQGQKIFSPDDWPADKNHYANGLSLSKIAPECQDLILWDDGSVAAGLRPLGKGRVVNLGIKFGSGRSGAGGNNLLMIKRILEWARVPKVPAKADGVMLRHYVSNNGLFDVWTIWNRDKEKSVDTDLVFLEEQQTARAAVDVLTGQKLTVLPTPDNQPVLKGIHLEPLEARIYLTPRNELSLAPLRWFKLQCNWWRGSRRCTTLSSRRVASDKATQGECRRFKRLCRHEHEPKPRNAETPKYPNVLNITDEWAYKILDENATEGQSSPTAESLADPDLADSDWPKRTLNCWAVPEELPSRHVFFRREFTVPSGWNNGTITLWLRSFFASTVVGKARYWLDGEEIPAGDGRYGLITPVDLAPGSTHCLAVEIMGDGQVCGVRGNTWLAYRPNPEERIDLAGEWTPSKDLLSEEAVIKLPGSVDGFQYVQRKVTVPEAWKESDVYIYLKTGHGITGAIVNGRYIRRHHHMLGPITYLNITPLLRFGEENTLLIPTPGGKIEITEVELWRYEK
jgi:hypothetical protein